MAAAQLGSYDSVAGSWELGFKIYKLSNFEIYKNL